MGRTITYHPLFKVELWQAYYLHPIDIEDADLFDPVNEPNTLSVAKQEELTRDSLVPSTYNIGNDLHLSPTPATQRLLEKQKMRFRTDQTGFSVWLQTKETATNQFEPFFKFDEPFKLSFYLQAKTAAFFHFTNVDFGQDTVYYFSNRVNNTAGNTLFLNRPPDDNTTPTNYISEADQVAMQNQAWHIDLTDLSLDQIRFELKSALHQASYTFEKASGDDALGILQLPLQDLPYGLYELTAFTGGNPIPELTRTFYWSQQEMPLPTLAVIELFFLPDETLGAYAWFDNQVQLQRPTYTLWWQNRSTHWRYIFDKDQLEPDSNDIDCHVKFEHANDHKILLSKEIQPLVHQYRKIRYRTASTNNNEEILLPNPAPNRIYPEGGAIFSEVYMRKIELNKIIQDTNLD